MTDEDFNEKMPSISMPDIDYMENKIDFFNDSTKIDSLAI